jgi:hypothetical protein
MDKDLLTTALTTLTHREITSLPESMPSELPEPPASRKSTPIATTSLLNETNADIWARVMKLDLTHHPRVRRLAAWAGYFVRRTLRNDRSGGTWLVLEGPTGTGKTMVGRFCVRAFNDFAFDCILAGKAKWPQGKKPRAELVSWSRFCLQSELHGDGPSRIDDARDNDVVVLDDVGAEADRFRSGSSKAMLRDFLEACERKWLLISTNIPKADWLEAFGARVADRMDAAKRFDTDGIPSYRPKLNREGAR